jgi:hypothetical protein
MKIVKDYGPLIKVLEESGRYIVRDRTGRKLGDYGDLDAAKERALKIAKDLEFPI